MQSTNIDFWGSRHFFFGLSALIVITSIVMLLSGKLQYGVDFKGGTVLIIETDKAITDDQLRKVLETDCRIKNARVQAVSGEAVRGKGKQALSTNASFQKMIAMEFLPDKQEKDKLSKAQVIEALKKGLGVGTLNVIKEDTVGPAVGADLIRQAIKAILFSLAGILLYVWFRFEFEFGVLSVVALFHDVLGTMLFIMLMKMEMDMSLLAVILTVIGYSINDTIVICDRIRENMKKMRRVKFSELCNLSINQTLSRTTLTSLTTLLPLVTLRMYGGPVLENFASAMMVGIVLGTYSSIFVVSNMRVLWHELSGEENRKAA